MTIFPDISRRARDKYHNLQDDDIKKNIFNSGRHKDKVGMQIPAWMITEEMKHTEHYQMYAEVFGKDVHLTQLQLTESTQGMHRTPSTPMSPNPSKEAAESSAPRRSTVIRLRIPERRSTRLTPPAPVPNVDKADEMILQDTLQVSLAEHKSREEQEARENVALVDEHLASEEIEKMVEITKDKEVEITKETPVVDITSVVIPVNANDEDEEITDGKTSEYEAYVSGESSCGQVFQEEQAPSTSGNQEQDDDFDFWTDSYALDDDEIPTKQRYTSGDEHQYHIDQMKNFLKSDIVWESKKEILVSLHLQNTTPLVHSYQQDPEAPVLSLINQDLLYLKKGNSGLEKIVLSLHKFPAIIFNDDDIEERSSRWVNKCVRKFNPYARYVFIISTMIWERVHDFQLGIESYQQKVNLTAPTMTFPRIEDHEIVLEGLKSYNIDIKYGYVQKDLTKDEAEYLKLFKEEIEERLKHHRQMRRWEMFVNGRPLGPRRERLE
ncbi:hypothetical protein Tco_0001665 [Tanacetum coccineum]